MTLRFGEAPILGIIAAAPTPVLSAKTRIADRAPVIGIRLSDKRKELPCLTLIKLWECLLDLLLETPLVPLEFQQSRNPENYITDFETGGVHSVKVGEWTDDTAMTLAMAEAILAEGHFVPNAVMDNFVSWYVEGQFIPRGVCFDIGNTTRNVGKIYR